MTLPMDDKTAPSETPLFAGVGTAPNLSLETALAESRAECERLRNQSNSLNTLNLGQIKIIADLQRQLRETETREREAYERAAKEARKLGYHDLADLIRALADERREG